MWQSHGWLLRSITVISYTEDIQDIVAYRDVGSHFYADDTQVYDRGPPQDTGDMQNWRHVDIFDL